ncbi:MAG: HAD-IIIA family hydrolase [Planctomycetota bacterium]|jgi:D-glycero-D-manno-heptose 1,7-bisphosphate phosphatase|nr:HAD-IIIA family hydrolase [Planctomycetota bacterium]
MNARPTVFLDRDGTILREVPYLASVSQTELLPGVAQALATLQRKGLQLIVVSNQSGVARGLLDEGKLLGIQLRIDDLLRDLGVRIDGYYHCPHHPSVGVAPDRRRCRCRKPLGGLLDRAAEDFEIDWARSVGIGDDLRDLQAFAAKEMPSVLVGTGKGRDSRQNMAEIGKEPDLFCAHLAEAVPWILRHTVELTPSP